MCTDGCCDQEGITSWELDLLNVLEIDVNVLRDSVVVVVLDDGCAVAVRLVVCFAYFGELQDDVHPMMRVRIGATYVDA